MIRLIASDIDGTLVRESSHHINPEYFDVIRALKAKGNVPRYGITTGKKVGNAVKRSRARRVIRASYYRLFPQLKPGYIIIFVARGKTPYVKSQVVCKAMKQHLKTLGILQSPDKDVKNEKGTAGID